jgi:hypothetical protein
MYLEFHDSEAGKSLVQIIPNIASIEEAEGWIKAMVTQSFYFTYAPTLVRFVLLDKPGGEILRAWERTEEEAQNNVMPNEIAI